MKSVLLALSAAGSVAAQLELPPQANIVAALNPDDPQYTACSVAEELVDYCVTSVGGTAALETADPTQFLDCACCVDGTAISPAYSICSTYIMDEAIQYSTEASAFGTFYSYCALDVDCDNLGGFTTTPVFTTSEETFQTTSEFAFSESTAFGSSATITAASSVQTYAEACSEMISIFESCTSKIADFTDLPYGEQASCYCCDGTVWNDDLDKFATTCANWAITGDPSTAYPVAKTFASLCEKFTDACNGATATATEATATGGSGGSSGGSSKNGQVTVTVTPTASATGNAATVPRVDFGVGAAAAVLAALPYAL